MYRNLLLLPLVAAINYNGFDLIDDGKGIVYANWCDFKNWFYKQESSTDRDCGPKCQADRDCTHFTFDPIHQQCFFKDGPVEKDTIIKSSLPQNQQNWMMPVCGFILDRNPQCPIVGDSIVCNLPSKPLPVPILPTPGGIGPNSPGNNGNPSETGASGNTGGINPIGVNPTPTPTPISPRQNDHSTTHSSATETPMTIKVVGAIANSPAATTVTPTNSPFTPLNPPPLQATPVNNGVNFPVIAGIIFGIVIAGTAVAMFISKRDDQHSLIDLYSQLPPVKPIPLAGPPKSILRNSALYKLQNQSVVDMNKEGSLLSDCYSIDYDLETPIVDSAAPEITRNIDFNFPPPPNDSNSSLNKQQVDDFVKTAKQTLIVPEKALFFKQQSSTDGQLLNSVPLVPINKE
ncbi:hypothetical protein HDV04_002547 [Boothiomyces sp. JEL0838]|nr:hypothetical protein HDV04_002547 [Boothiomyces sp. JEL0838]